MYLRTSCFKYGYKYVLKPIFFKLNPETVHDHMVAFGQQLGSNRVAKTLTKFAFTPQKPDPILEQTLAGITFQNPIGLAGGFDKNAQLTDILPSLGFGFMEVGSITGEPCEGNPKPRLWRLKNSKSLLVYYGLKNDGAEAIAKRLTPKKFDIPLGINIAKTNCQATADPDVAIADYVKAYRAFANIGSYTTINISCPNAFGGQPFTDPNLLDRLLKKIATIPCTKPIFLKLSPDLSHTEIDAILEVVSRYPITGIICSNLTKNRTNNHIKDQLPVDYGGMSGEIVKDLANELISYIYKKTNSKYIIIGLGGVASAQDAYDKICRGASLVQLITGMIFNGPQSIGEINEGLADLLHKNGHKNIQSAIGSAHS